MGQFNKAIADYDEAIRLDSEHVDAYNNRANVYCELGQYERAIDDFNEAIRLDPEYALVYYNRGNTYRVLGQYERAIDDFNEAIRLDPQYAEAYDNRGVAYLLLGQYERAINDYDEAIRLDPEVANGYVLRAIAYTYIGMDAKAQQDVNRAVELGFDRKSLEEAIEWAKQERSIGEKEGKEIELKHDDGKQEGIYSAQSNYGYIVEFVPPTTPLRIKEVRIFGILTGSGWEGKEFTVYIVSNEGQLLYEVASSVTKFYPDRPKWVAINIPDVEISNTFHVLVYTGTGPFEGIHIGTDLSGVNEHSNVTIRQPNGTFSASTHWPWPSNAPLGDKNKVQWMIRVIVQT